jgi:nucleotide-binding universal stress UspA family protein
LFNYGINYEIGFKGWISMFDKILVPLDCSKFAEESLNVAIEIAKKFKSQLFLMHVFPMHAEYRRAGVTGKMRARARAHDTPKIREEIPQVCTDLLVQSKSKVTAEGIPVQTLLKEGHVVEEILKTLRQGDFDLVVMGARGQSMIKNLLLGSVSSGVIRYASCPVLVTKK